MHMRQPAYAQVCSILANIPVTSAKVDVAKTSSSFLGTFIGHFNVFSRNLYWPEHTFPVVTHLPLSCEISEIELPSSLWKSVNNDYTQMQQVTYKMTMSTNFVYISVGSLPPADG